MLEVITSGTPTEIGVQHGTQASLPIKRCLKFYKLLFQNKAQMNWNTVRIFALKYQSFLTTNFPDFVAEMEGIADGASVTYADILALNVRTEIAFGAFNDGCTAVSWKSGDTSYLAQNWDWNMEQAENLIVLRIKRDGGRGIEMVTEAGIIGKIGINGRGVGCTLNAVKAKGVRFGKLPCHLALRAVLDCGTREEAVGLLEKWGVASSCHILVADETGGTGMECSSEDAVKLEMGRDGVVTHTNHFVLGHVESVVESHDWLVDTRFRLERVRELVHAAEEEGPSVKVLEKILRDEVEGDGAAICRTARKDSLATLFSIVMDLNNKKARVTVGRPASSKEQLILEP